ncbi:LysR family transcriptional regulator [Rhizobium puerariae]|uniref:LysR family transcriptional regulator n=1 Tax=Rhizobium puerariae TaxID=1585791 RepID=A0ABV6AEC6_9HYPH
MINITVTQLKYLDAVIRAGSFSKAALAANISQPALTRHIQSLEEECRVPLLRRTSRGVFPTEEGSRLLDASARVFESLDYVQSIGASLVGKTLRIRSVSTPRLADFVGLCRANLLNVEIDLSISTFADILEALHQRRCDIGFFTAPAGLEGVEAVEIGRYKYHAYVGRSHAWADRSQISIRELEGVGLIISPSVRRSRQVFDDHLHNHGVVAPILYEVASIETIWHLARLGTDVGILSDLGHAVSDDIVRLEFAEDLSIPLHMVSLAHEERTNLARAAFALGAKQLAAH